MAHRSVSSPTVARPSTTRAASRLVAVVTLALASACPGGEVTTDAGVTVEPGWVFSQPFPEIESLHDVVVVAEARAYAVGSGGAILRYEDGTWTQEESGSTALLRGVSGVRNAETGVDTVLAVGDDGVVLLRDDDDTWVTLTTNTDKILFDVWVAAANDAFVVGEGGTILRFTGVEVVPMTAESLQTRRVEGPLCTAATECNQANGETCAPIDPMNPMSSSRCQDPNDPNGLIEETFPIPVSFKTVAGYSSDNVFAAGPTGALYRFDGQTWFPEDMGTSRSISHLFTGAGTWATANDGVILIRGGGGWDSQALRAPVPLFLQGLWASGWDDLHVVGLSGTIYSWNGEEWGETTFEEDFHFRAIDGVVLEPATETTPVVREVFAVGAGGRIAHGPAILPDDAQ